METKRYLKIWLPSGIYYSFAHNVRRKDFAQAFRDSSREHKLDTGDSLYRIWDFRHVKAKNLFTSLSTRLTSSFKSTPTFARHHKNFILVNRSVHQETVLLLQYLHSPVYIIQSLREISSFKDEVKMLEITKTIKEAVYHFNAHQAKGEVS